MKNQKKQSYIKMLNSNQDFYLNLEKENYDLDNYILAELIALYCVNNSNDYCEKYIHEMAKMNYIVDKDELIIKDEKISITSAIEYITKREKNKYFMHRKEPIFINFNNQDDCFQNENHAVLINFKEEKKQMKYNKRYELINDAMINDSTNTYIKSVNNDFNNLINNTIIKLLNNKTTQGIESIHIALIYSLINLLLNTEYNNELPLCKFNIPRNMISVKKGSYNQEEIIKLELEVRNIDEEINKQSQRIRYIKTYAEEEMQLIETVENYINNLQNQKEYLMDQIFQLKFTQENFNTLIISTLSKSLHQKNIEFREEIKDPTITSFTQTKNIVENVIEMHLHTFVNMIDNEEIIKYYNCEPLYLRFTNKG